MNVQTMLPAVSCALKVFIYFIWFLAQSSGSVGLKLCQNICLQGCMNYRRVASTLPFKTRYQ